MNLLQPRRQAGLTLVELMIALTLSLLVTLVGATLLSATSSTYHSQDDVAQVQDSGRFAIDLISRIIRQTEYENWEPVTDATSGYSTTVNSVSYSDRGLGMVSPAIMGANNALVADDNSPTYGSNDGGGINGSDAIRLRYFGVNAFNSGLDADNSIIDCAGNGIPAPLNIDQADTGRGTTIFSVKNEATGEPSLYCKYRGTDSTWKMEPIVKGVENLQFLYGIDTNADSFPNVFLPASRITTDADWRRVVAVQVSLIVRSPGTTKLANPGEQFNLFGPQYNDGNDPGTVVKVSTLPATVQGRLRKMYTATIFLRNQIIN